MKLSRIALGVVLVLAALGGGVWGLRGVLRWREARALAIAVPGGVDERGYVDIGGVPQWIQIRGQRRSNPIVLIVHGGPGFAMSPFVRLFRPWEADFTVVQWDQRDAGRTFSRNGAQPISLDQIARDGVAVAERLRQRLPGAPIIVLGHSWGSAVGLEMVHRRPDLFAAYVGAGQMSAKPEQEAISYQRVSDRLRASGRTAALAELQRVGPPPYRDLKGLLVERKWLAAVDTPAERMLFRRMAAQLMVAPGMSLRNDLDYLAAPKVAQKATFTENITFEARRTGLDYRLPIIVVEGDQDLYTPVEPTARWLADVQAPAKALVVLKGGGHDALLTTPEAFRQVLLSKVKPQLHPAPRG